MLARASKRVRKETQKTLAYDISYKLASQTVTFGGYYFLRVSNMRLYD